MQEYLFVLSLVMTSIQVPTLVAAGEKKGEEKLVNIAPESEITVPSSEAGKEKENLVDGDDTTLWVQNGDTWPSEVSLKLPADNTKKIKKIVESLTRDILLGR